MATEKAVEKKASEPSQGAAMVKTSGDTCFTIMPFGGWFDEYYTSIYKPAIISAGLNPCRADDLNRPSSIINDIWEYTKSANLILADLTGKNPNVFYELGLAHALAKPAILIAESMDEVPFDLQSLRVLVYDKNLPRWGDDLQERITKAIQEVLASPIEAVLPTFLTVSTDSRPISITQQEKDMLEIKREMDLLRNEFSALRVSPIESDNNLNLVASIIAKNYMGRSVSKGNAISNLLTGKK
jgi:hypothetical protein